MTSRRKIRKFAPLEIHPSALQDPEISFNPLSKRWYKDPKGSSEPEEFKGVYVSFQPLEAIIDDKTKFNPEMIMLRIDKGVWYCRNNGIDVPLPGRYIGRMKQYLIDEVYKEVVTANSDYTGHTNLHHDTMMRIAVDIVHYLHEPIPFELNTRKK